MKLDNLPPYLLYRLWQNAPPQRRDYRPQRPLPVARRGLLTGLLVAGGLLAFAIVSTVLPPTQSSAPSRIQQTQERPLIILSSPPASFWTDPRFAPRPLPRVHKRSAPSTGRDLQLDEDFLWSEYDRTSE